ncbi:maltokinase N-terminal cap-like domain-containing protein [Yinghuangia aomiensis]
MRGGRGGVRRPKPVRGDPGKMALAIVLGVAAEEVHRRAQRAAVDHHLPLLGVRRWRVDRLDHATIGRVGGDPAAGAVLYDAAHDSELEPRAPLERFAAAGAGDPCEVGPLVFQRCAERAPRGRLAGLVVGAEQRRTRRSCSATT